MNDVFYERITDMATCPHCGVCFPDFSNNRDTPLSFATAVFGFLFFNMFIINLYAIVFQKFSDVFEKQGLVKVEDVAKTGLFEDGFSFFTSPVWMVVLMTSLVVFATLCIGLVLDRIPESVRRGTWMMPALIGNLVLFLVGTVAILFLGAQDVMASTLAVTGAVAGEAKDISVGMGLAIMGAGLPTGFSTIAAGLAVGPIGSASLAALAEKPEMFGRTLVYLGLAEGIAIYGLVMSILLLDRI